MAGLIRGNGNQRSPDLEIGDGYGSIGVKSHAMTLPGSSAATAPQWMTPELASRACQNQALPKKGSLCDPSASEFFSPS